MVSSDGWLWVFRAGIGFLLLAALLFLLGYATDHWHDNDNIHYGLWNTCDRVRCTDLESDELPAYHIATQAFQTMAVIFFSFSPIVHLVVYCLKKGKDTGWRSRILDIGYSSGIVFHVCSLLVFGLEHPKPEDFSWSYKMSCASSAIAFFGIIMIIISRSKALYKFTFSSASRSKRKTAAANLSNPQQNFERASFRAIPFHQQEKLIISSTSQQQAHLSNDSGTNVNINIHINTGPSNSPDIIPSSDFSNSVQSSVEPSSSSSSYSHRHPDTSIHPRIVPENHQPLHPKPSSTPVEYPLTQVRPAPKSSISHYSSPAHKNTFGPADRRQTFPSPSSGETPIPTVSGLISSAPPNDDNDLEDDHPPPSYFDVMKTDSQSAY